MLETILGGALGGIARLAPEVLKFFDSKDERKHELRMGEQNLKLVELQQKGQLAVADVEVQGKQFTAAMEAIRAGVEAQGKPTGIRWVDALSSSVRPIITYWIFLLYAAVKTAVLSVAIETQASLENALMASWTASDDAMLSAVLTFWFVGRVWDKNRP